MNLPEIIPVPTELEGKPIPDIQSKADTRQLAIDQVGIRAIRHPVKVRDRSHGEQYTIATFNMYVGLPHNFKGTHMSRFIEVLNDHDNVISIQSFRDIVKQVADKLDSETSRIEMTFPYFLEKAAPVTAVKSLVDYEATLYGDLNKDEVNITTSVVVPVTSLCPCSKEISDYGAHNQRSHVTITVRTDGFVWLEELIELAEDNASSQLYGLLKRPDEKFVTEQAYDNPKFVEDMVRDIAGKLIEDDRVVAYTVESENFESIHNHSAYARISGVKQSQNGKLSIVE
ncbi:MAG: GTP cyclohydrolase FolE2 [Acidiferrobacterales bacterium]|nr:GTP cyclohydrolase FolE2 [Acidiferrobacterales bacterium]